MIFIIIIGRKAIIMTVLSNQAEKSKNQNNYYTKIYMYQGEDTTLIETYHKDGKYLTTVVPLGELKNNKIIEFKDKAKTNIYIESDNDKIAVLNAESNFTQLTSINFLRTNNIGEFLRNLLLTSFRSVKCNGIDCYYISNFNSPTLATSEGDCGIYINKETGMPVRVLGGTMHTNNEVTDGVLDYYYEYNKVTEENIKEPELEQYQIQNKE